MRKLEYYTNNPVLLREQQVKSCFIHIIFFASKYKVESASTVAKL